MSEIIIIPFLIPVFVKPPGNSGNGGEFFQWVKVLPIWNPNFALEIEQALGDHADSGARFLTYWNADMISNGLLIFIVAITVFEIGVTIYKTLRYGASIKNG